MYVFYYDYYPRWSLTLLLAATLLFFEVKVSLSVFPDIIASVLTRRSLSHLL